MPTVTARKKVTKPVVRTCAAKSATSSALRGQQLTGQALLEDMEVYRKKVSSTPETALNFLTRLGVITPTGKARKLIRG